MMGRTSTRNLWIAIGIFLAMSSWCFSAVPMGTAITYQGRFTSGGTPANGAYDFEFRAFDAATGGNQVGNTITQGNLTVTDGYFTSLLDFGPGVFTGDARWLQIAVRPAGQGSYTTLTPRHELTPTPYTLYSGVQGTANYISKFTASGLTNSTLYEANGNVGIGTTSPGSRLHVVGPASDYTATFQGSTTAGQSYGPVIRAGTGAGDLALQINNATGSTRLLTVQGDGNVGIGTTNPTAPLEVNGAIRAPGIWTYLTSYTVPSDMASVTISAIPSGYKFLKVIFKLAGTSGAATEMRLRFNGDTASNYCYVFVYGNSVSAGSGGAFAAYIRLGGVGANRTPTYWAMGELTITNIASEYKSGTAFYSGHDPGVWSEVGTLQGYWKNSSSEINSLTLWPASGNVKAGSTVIIQGMTY